MTEDHRQNGAFVALFTKMRDAVVAQSTPTVEEMRQMAPVRDEAAGLLAAILAYVPPGPDRQAAIRKVREAVMVCESSVVMRGTDPTRD